MRVDVLEERCPTKRCFHTVAAPGLGVWRRSAPGVKVYKYLKQVTNLSAPGRLPRVPCGFRWLSATGRLLQARWNCTPPPLRAARDGPLKSSNPAGPPARPARSGDVRQRSLARHRT